MPPIGSVSWILLPSRTQRRRGFSTPTRRASQLREAARLVDAVDAAGAAESSVEEQAAAGFAAFTQAVVERPVLAQLMRAHSEQDNDAIRPSDLFDQSIAMARDCLAAWVRHLQVQGRYQSVDADIVGEIAARLAFSLVLAPEGSIPMRDNAAVQTFARHYLVALLGAEVS